MRKEKKYNYIYKTTCLITDRFYIGLHSTNNLDDGYMGSGKRLWYSFKKYGKENHKVEILEYFKTRKELKQREKEIVNEELIGKELCMNLALGGTGGILSEEHKKVFIKAANEGYVNKIKTDSKFRNKVINNLKKYNLNNHKNGLIKPPSFKGNRHSEESKKKMSESKKGKGLGITNSQYGTIWITNETSNQKIGKNDIIPKGWRRGRVI